ncbi:MAG TPA: glycine dehydrogenase subunit 2 [candidate division Zixibacteria bacterium]|nr:glycine dehydrogenase subunit 2 [candidate division Zixibacteria bacterium]
MTTKIIEPTLFEKSRPGLTGASLPPSDVPPAETSDIPEKLLRKGNIGLPELAEVQVMRHYVRLSNLNHHVEKGFYPLGSCTMKYNPKANEDAAGLPGFTHTHPVMAEETSYGTIELMAQLGEMLCEISGHNHYTLQPAAGAHGELTGLLMIRAYHEKNGNPRKNIIIPDSSHGTNPASIVFAGYEPVEIKSTERGTIDLAALEAALSEDTAALMVTNPNTLGLFEKDIVKVCEMAHAVGAQMYMDGANLNAMMGYVRPADLGFDVAHFNLHKTFSTPHGGGGPGSGPLSVADHLEPFLPRPVVRRDENGEPIFDFDRPDSIGKMQGFYGNFLVMVKAWLYLRMLGTDGVKEVTEWAILNANYLLSRLVGHYNLQYKDTPLHEFVIDSTNLKQFGIRNVDVAKRLLDHGFHAPTMSFPLIVPEALMTEPTETESKASLDSFADAMIEIAREARENPEILHSAPTQTPIGRLDEGKAARLKILRWPIPDEI